MRIVSSFPRQVLDIENVFIPLSDGTRLAARIWRPEDAEDSPVPAILEYIPYRKRDRMRERDEPIHHYFAGHGYAAVRVDLRGTGDSEGVLLDEYHAQEIDDALEVITWLAERSWCTGAVGMMGKSWGGFNALQVAARRPKELGAIISVCASDDRFLDDAHYMGGALLNENLVWGSTLLTLAALPPDPALWGERWRELWKTRLEGLSFFPELWLRHPLRDDYWKHGSVSEDYAAIACPVYAVGGWYDAYTNAIPRLLASLSVPRKGLVGPWAHVYPHNGVPGPPIGFLQEALRWWDHWLLGRDTGLHDEPMYRLWMPEGAKATTGRWVAEPRWPSERTLPRRYHLGSGSLDTEPSSGLERAFRSPLDTGLRAGSWCPFGAPDEMATDQREDDARSLTLDSEALPETLEILGAPTLRLRLSADRSRGLLAARLEDVLPDGSSVRVTYGLLNLTHRESHRRPSPLVPGEIFEVTLSLNHVAHGFAPSHRIRIALSTVYWPVAWPSPEPLTLVLHAGSSLDLPVRPPRPEDETLRPFEPPESAPNARTSELRRGATIATLTRDLETGAVVYRVASDSDDEGEPALTRVEATGMEHGHAVVETFSIAEPDPSSARAEVLHDMLFRREGFRAQVRAAVRLESDEASFRLEGSLEALEEEQAFFSKTWRATIPREWL